MTTATKNRIQRRLSRNLTRTTLTIASMPRLGRVSTGGLVDTFGRTATDLRVSLTDRCNLRCSYCMPAEGLDWLPSEETLTDDEVVRLVRIAVEHLGIREVRFTGGEPLVRRGLVDIVRRTSALDPRPETSLTTNALGLSPTWWPGSRRPRQPDWARSRSTRCCCAASTTTRLPSCCAGASSASTSCASSSRCRSTPS